MIIVFKNEDDSVGIIIPTQQAIKIMVIDVIAKKDTPSGLPYWIVEDSEIPTDQTHRDAWRFDPAWGEPNGYGE